MSEVVGEGVLQLRVDESGVDFNRVGTQAQKGGTDAGGKFSKGFLGSMKGLATAAAASFAAVGVGTFLKTAISGASDLQETISKTGVVFGKASDDILAFASTGAKALGLSKQAALDAASTFGVLGKAAGLTGSDLSAFSTDLTSLSVDLASFHNAEPQEVIDALGAALRGEAEPMRRFGVLLDDASLKNEALRLGLIKTTKDALTPQQKTLAAQALIMKQTADAQGDFERTSGGLANQQRILSASFQDLTTKIGSAFLPIALSAVKGLNQLVSSAAELGPVVDKVGAVFSSAFSGGGGIGGAGAAVQQFADGLRMAFDVLKSGEDVAQGLGETLDFALGNTGDFVAPIRDAVTQIEGLFDSLQSAAADVFPVVAGYFTDSLIPAATKLASFLGTTLVPVFNKIVEVIATQVIPTVAAVAEFFYGTLLPAIVQIGTEVGTKLAPVFRQLAETFTTQILPAVAKAAATFRDDLLPVLQPIITKVVQVVGAVLKFAAAILGRVLPPVIRFVGFILANVIPAIVKLIVIFAQIITKAGQFAATIGRAVASVVRFVTNMNTTVTRAVSSVVSSIAGLPGKILGFVGKMLAAGKSLIGALFKGIVSAAKGGASFVGDLASQLVSAVKNAVNDALNLPLKIKFDKGPIHIDATVIPRFAGGTNFAPGGTALVGEEGPELIDLPRGSRVYTASQTSDMVGGAIDYAALAAAIAAAIAPLVRPVTVQTPASDPEAVAMQVANRLVSLTG